MALIWRKQGTARRRKLAAPCEHERGGGMGDMGAVGALVIGAPRGAPRGHLYRQGMRGMGASARDVLNTLTGGAVGTVEQKLGKIETALKLSTAAALISAVVSLYSLRRK
jgi:hypothetical protein